MEDDQFAEIRGQVDAFIDATQGTNLGVAMGFALAGEFLVRGLLETHVSDVLWRLEVKTYRGRAIYPDPMMGDFDCRFGQPRD